MPLGGCMQRGGYVRLRCSESLPTCMFSDRRAMVFGFCFLPPVPIGTQKKRVQAFRKRRKVGMLFFFYLPCLKGRMINLPVPLLYSSFLPRPVCRVTALCFSIPLNARLVNHDRTPWPRACFFLIFAIFDLVIRRCACVVGVTGSHLFTARQDFATPE